jgi:tetratricopeptide (TPR) repeat protein
MNILRTSIYAGLGVATALIATGGTVRAETCQMKQVASFPINVGIFDDVLLPVLLDGKRTTNFLVDTGAPMSLVTAGIADELKLSRHTASAGVMGAGGGVINQKVKLNSLKLGNLIDRNTWFFVHPAFQNEIYNIGGIFAADYLYNYDIDLDFSKKKINLFLQSNCGDQVVYWNNSYVAIPIEVNNGRHIIVEVKLDGKPIKAMLDTGATNSSITVRKARDLYDLAIDAPDVTAMGKTITGDGAKLQTYRHQFKTLEVGGITFNNPQISLLSEPRIAENQMPELVLGMRELERLHLYIAYHDNMIYATPLDAEALKQQADDHRQWAWCNGQGVAGASDGPSIDQQIDACSAVTQVAGLEPQLLATVFGSRGLARQTKREYDQAIQDFDQAIQLAPKYAAVFFLRGVSYRTKHDYDNAIFDYDQAIQLDPKLPAPWNSRCELRARRGDLANALSDCDEAVKLAPKSGDVFDTRAFVHLQAGRLDAAMADYDRALALRPDFPQSLYGRGLVKQRKGDGAGGDADIAAATKLRPDIVEVFAQEP